MVSNLIMEIANLISTQTNDKQKIHKKKKNRIHKADISYNLLDWHKYD